MNISSTAAVKDFSRSVAQVDSSAAWYGALNQDSADRIYCVISSTSIPSSFLPRTTEEQLLRVLQDRFMWATQKCQFASIKTVATAANEAADLICSNIFNEHLLPEILVDEYGEFSFVIKRDSAYIDIGVRGENELSYHVRNDSSGASVYDDIEINDSFIPDSLREALEDLILE